MFRSTESVKNQFEPANVTCKVEEVFNGTEKTSIKVQNTGNIPCYLRLRLVTYWVDKDGKIVGKPSPTLVVPIDETHWKKGEDDTFYYLTPVEPGKSTGELLKASLPLGTDEFNNETVYQVVNVFAEAIQAAPQKAVEEAWTSFPSN